MYFNALSEHGDLSFLLLFHNYTTQLKSSTAGKICGVGQQLVAKEHQMFLFLVLYISNTYLSILADPSNADFWIKLIDVFTAIPFKVPITPKYFFCLNKSLHLFETHCAFLK